MPRFFRSGSFNTEQSYRRFQPAKELQLIQNRIKPTVGDAVVHIERLRVMSLMMLRFKHQPLALQPARKTRGIFLMRPLVKLISRDRRRCRD